MRTYSPSYKLRIFVKLIVSFVLIDSLTVCKGQEHKVTMDLGYAFEPNQFTPHIWLGYNYGTKVTFGAVGFHNLDRIKREWPNEGIYFQTRNHFGFGLRSGYHHAFKKHELFSEIIFGIGVQAWKVTSKSKFLRNAILPREEFGRSEFYQIRAGYQYKLSPDWTVGISGGIGENNVSIHASRIL